MTISFLTLFAIVALAILVTGLVVSRACDKTDDAQLWGMGIVLWVLAFFFFQAGAKWQRLDFEEKQQTQKADH